MMYEWSYIVCKLYVVLGIYDFDKTFKYVDKHEENETGIGIAWRIEFIGSLFLMLQQTADMLDLMISCHKIPF